jgi:hypothetical protein
MRKLIKRWEFEEAQRSRIVLVSGVRLDPEGFLELESNASGFLTTANLSAKTWLSTPRSAKRFIGFESFHVNRTVNLVQVTNVKFRLSRDGIEQLFWNGSAWVAAASGNWNTEAEVANNISSLALSDTHRGLQVIVNLSTTNATQSPQVMHVKALYDSDVEWLEDLIARSLKPALEAGIRPIAEAVALSTGASTITLTTEASYQIASIDTVYNLTTDPEKLADIFQSFNSTTKVVTLTTAPASGDKILIRFKYAPKIDLMPSQDIIEIAEVPAIGIGNIRTTMTRPFSDHESVINKATGAGWRLAGGEQADIEVPLNITTSKEKDAHRVSDAVQAFFKENPLLTLKGVDELVRVLIWEEHIAANYSTMAGVHSASLRARILGYVSYRKDAELVHAVQNLIVSGTVNVQLPGS